MRVSVLQKFRLNEVLLYIFLLDLGIGKLDTAADTIYLRTRVYYLNDSEIYAILEPIIPDPGTYRFGQTNLVKMISGL